MIDISVSVYAHKKTCLVATVFTALTLLICVNKRMLLVKQSRYLSMNLQAYIQHSIPKWACSDSSDSTEGCVPLMASLIFLSQTVLNFFQKQ